jgi:ATP-dependent protease Clp ATPase subunit
MKIVSGPSVHICNECIQICNDIIASECGKDPDKETGSQSLSPLGLEEVLAWLNKNSFRVTLASRPRWRFSLSK